MYEQGYLAGIAGMSLESNPNAKNAHGLGWESDAYLQWEAGWWQAYRERTTAA